MVTLNLTINQPKETTINASICEGETYAENNFNVSTAGVHTQNLKTVNDCDSIVTLNLTVNQPAATVFNETICRGAIYDQHNFSVSTAEIEGNSYSTTQNWETVNGCDSIVTLNLTILEPKATMINASIERGLTYNENGFDIPTALLPDEVYTESRTEKTTNGCDSVVTLHLTLQNSHNGHDFVDLGLPSGTLWATCNIGATTPEDYGNHFMWGYPTNSNSSDCSWTGYTRFGTYNESNTPTFGFDKYNGQDGKTTLELLDDAANADWNGYWRIPTAKQMQELVDECEWNWTTQEGVYGCVVTGKNGKSIFLPAAGYRQDNEFKQQGEYATYQTSTLSRTNECRFAVSMYFTSSVPNISENYSRFYGRSVRAVVKCKPDINTLEASEVTKNSAVLNAEILSEGESNVTEKGFLYSRTKDFEIGGEDVIKVVAAGEDFNFALTNITYFTYYVRAYATNQFGTAYGEQISFKYDPTNGYEYVDLGLPSGLLWATKNVGASCEICYGDYFAWGETEDKWMSYEWSNYKYGTYSNLTKYCNKESEGIVDNKTTLDLEDDAAHTNWGGEWRMPTKAEWEELINHSTSTWETANDPNYLGTASGRKLTSNQEGNENSIFLPSTGVFSGSVQLGLGVGAEYWSSTLWDGGPNSAFYYDFQKEGGTNHVFAENRRVGMNVRAVLGRRPIVSTLEATNITPNSAVLNGQINSEDATTIAEKGFVYATTENPEVDGEGVIKIVVDDEDFSVALTNLAYNTYYVRAYAINVLGVGYGEQKTFSINQFNGHEYVDLGLPSGLLWATMNVGATSPEGYGHYFAWGETARKSNYSYSNYTYRDETPDTLSLANDAAAVNWGGYWRMPTKAEQNELITECVWEWQNDYNGTGIAGYKVKSKKEGNENYIFLPAAGHLEGSANSDIGVKGWYWSSMHSSQENRHCLYFYKGWYTNFSGLGRYGFTVRAVIEP